jgi:peroxiredoxin Q/BCP
MKNFSLESTAGEPFNLKDYRGKNLILYFYPKDNTSGCTKEGEDFALHHAKFIKLNTYIFGISRDSIDSHQKFRTKKKFPFDLLSDPKELACKLFDVIKLKNMYGKKMLGIERSTFLINSESKLIKEWRKVKVEGHVMEVLKAVKEL